MAKKQKKEVSNKSSQAIAIVALILNILILPGLGTLIAGKIKIGVWQVVLAIISVPLMFVLIGIPLMIGVWIWGIITGVKLIQESQ